MLEADRLILDQFRVWRDADRAADALGAIAAMVEASKAGDAPLLEMVALPAAGLPGLAIKIAGYALISCRGLDLFPGPDLEGRFVGPDIRADDVSLLQSAVRDCVRLVPELAAELVPRDGEASRFTGGVAP